MTAVAEEISRKSALRLWDKLRQHFENAQRVIEEIIETRAWEPLGYETFAEAWTATMSDVPVAAAIRSHVVYQMFSEGLNVDAIVAAVNGISHHGVESLQRQRNNGVPPEFALVHEHLRTRPSPRRFVRVDLGDHLPEYQQIAKRLGTTVSEILSEAGHERFAELRHAMQKMS
jgi:hypothetical protein